MKRLISILLLSTASFAYSQTLPPVMLSHPVKAWLLMDYDSGEILAEYNGKQKLEPASITKVMTSYLIAEAIENKVIDPEALVTISPYARSQEGSRMFVETNSKIAVKDLILGMVIQSGNDSSIALAEYLHGSEPNFAVEMNKKARELGMLDTHFENATGLPGNNHITTAYDLALLSRHLIHDFPSHYRIYSQKSFEWNKIKQNNRNSLLWTDPSVDGIKTGHTSSAGYNLASSAVRNNFRVISVVLGAKNEKERAKVSEELLNYAFLNFENKELYKANAPIYQAKLYEGDRPTVSLGVKEKFIIAFPRGQYQNLSMNIHLKKPLLAPIEQGQVIGTLTVKNGSAIIATRDLIALETVDQASIFKRYWDKLKYKSLYKFKKLKENVL